MNRYKGILLSSTLLLSTSVFAASTTTTTTTKPATTKATPSTAKTVAAPTKGATANPQPTKGAAYGKPADPGHRAVRQWEPHAMGGIATLEADDIEIQMTPIEMDTLEQSNASAWDSWTVTAGLGYIFPLFGAKVYSRDVQWFTAIQPQLNVYYLQGDMDGDVNRFSDFPGEYNDTEYTLEFKSTRLMFDTSLTVASWRMVSIYAIGGVGISWNTIDLDEHASDCVSSVDLDNNDTNFVWEVGAGITFAATKHLALSFEYLFTQFENLELGENGTLGDSGSTLSEVESESFDLNSQALMLGLRYAF